MIPEHLIFLDLETTGANHLHDRITEIGLCDVRNGRVAEEWSTLVNPEVPISPFIENLTGITTAMVAEAPRFAEIAAELQERLTGGILVAHNARFDYGFLKSEFRRIGLEFTEKTLCTVKLSRALFPDQRRHNLDTVIREHALPVTDRHRALGDARVIQAFFAKLRNELPEEDLDQAIRAQLKQPNLPPHLDAGQVEDLPTAPGVYLFYGEDDAVLYVGKSVDLRSRVLSHFAVDLRNRKGMKLSRQVRRIEIRPTAGELGALLLEARLIKELSPIHNRRLRRSRDLFSIQLKTVDADTSQPEIIALNDPADTGPDRLFGLYRTRRQAQKALQEIIHDQGLCNIVLGLEKGSGACFNYQIKKCRGACVGDDPRPLHEARLLTALAGLKLRCWPYPGPIGLKETSPAGDLTEIHLFDRWCYLGTADSEERLWALLEAPTLQPFDLDHYKTLLRYLDKKGRRLEILDVSRISGRGTRDAGREIL